MYTFFGGGGGQAPPPPPPKAAGPTHPLLSSFMTLYVHRNRKAISQGLVNGGGGSGRLCTLRYIVTTRTDDSWAATRAIFYVWSDKVTRQCPQTTAFLKRRESRSGIKLRPPFCLPAECLTARPNWFTPRFRFSFWYICWSWQVKYRILPVNTNTDVWPGVEPLAG